MSYESSSMDFIYDIDSNNFSQIDRRQLLVNCNSTNQGGFVKTNFIVTPSGIVLETSESILYIVLIFINLLVFVFFLYWTITLPYANETDQRGDIVRVVKAKYLKLLSALFAYGSFMWFFAMFTGIVNNFISLEIYKSLITNLYVILSGVGLGFMILIFAILFIEVWRDILFNKEIKKFGKAILNG